MSYSREIDFALTVQDIDVALDRLERLMVSSPELWPVIKSKHRLELKRSREHLNRLISQLDTGTAKLLAKGEQRAASNSESSVRQPAEAGEKDGKHQD